MDEDGEVGTSRWRTRIRRVLTGVLLVLAMLVPALLVFAFGWPHTLQRETTLYYFSGVALTVYGLCELGLLAVSENPLGYAKRNAIVLVMAVLSIGAGIASGSLVDNLSGGRGIGGLKFLLLVYIIVSQSILLLTLLIRSLRERRGSWMTRMQPRTVVIVSFLSLILTGALMLKTPNATVTPISWVDALFTSASAVCVTGLTVVDTATAFKERGQGVILVLIQLGGLGLMTYTFFLAMLAGEGISLHDRVLLREMLSERNMGFISRTLVEILLLTLVVESIGAVLIYHTWAPAAQAGTFNGWHAVFHSVSASCNAGFSTLSGNLADPQVAGRRGLQVVIMCLVVAGGLGFPVLRELRQRTLGLIFPRYFPVTRQMTLHARVVLSVTALLLSGGALMLLLCDLRCRPAWTFRRGGRCSTPSRRAPPASHIDNVADYSTPVCLTLMLLMFIGGSPQAPPAASRRRPSPSRCSTCGPSCAASARSRSVGAPCR
jgi:hypothetical protein